MAGRALCWQAVAVTLFACCYGLLDISATWPNCSATNFGRVVKRGEADDSIIWLYLESCNITSLKTNELEYSKLETLSLKDNNIEFIETGAFDSLGSMSSLYLNSNKFLGKNLPPSLFRNCSWLYHIEFSNNDMSDTPSNLLQGLNNLKSDLYCNNCSLREMPTFITHSVLPLGGLHLNHNRLTRLDDPATFVNLSNINDLELQFNEIDYLHEDLLKPLINIWHIDLSSNEIRRIPERLFQNKSQLAYVILANNLIDYVPERAFLGTRLAGLSISDNRLVYLPENFLELYKTGISTLFFFFDGNPWSCACLNELLVKLKQLNIRYEHSEYDGKHKTCIITDSFKCHRPNTYRELYKKHISDGH